MIVVRAVIRTVMLQGKLPEKISTLLVNASQAWPRVHLSQRSFLEHLQLVSGDKGVCWTTLHLKDLYLACACCEGDAAAIEAFCDRYGPVLDGVLRRCVAREDSRLDIRQLFLSKLFVASSDSRPGISKYSGHGTLAGWLSISLTRFARRQQVSTARHSLVLEHGLELMAHSDPELELLKATSRDRFSEAFDVAIQSLTTHDRLLLALRFVDRKTPEEIACIYDVHRSTISRALTRSQRSILKVVTDQLDDGVSEFRSVLKLVRSQIEIQLNGLREPATSDGCLGEESVHRISLRAQR